MPFALRKSSRKSRNTYTYNSKKEKSALITRKPTSKNTFSPIFRGKFTSFFHFISLKSIAAISLAIIGVGVTVAAIFGISFWLYSKAVTSNFFATKHIDIAGNVRLSRDMVLQYGGINEGDNSLSVSIAEIERNLHDTPWVEEVSVKRLLPDRFVIKLKERLPSFWIQKDGTLYYANEKGEIIAPVESRNFLSLPTLTIEPGGEESSIYLSKLLKDLRNDVLPIEAGSIASITASASRGIEIYLEDREMRLSISTDDWEKKKKKIGIALGDLARRQELGRVRELRVVDGNVWVIRDRRAGITGREANG